MRRRRRMVRKEKRPQQEQPRGRPLVWRLKGNWTAFTTTVCSSLFTVSGPWTVCQSTCTKHQTTNLPVRHCIKSVVMNERLIILVLLVFTCWSTQRASSLSLPIKGKLVRFSTKVTTVVSYLFLLLLRNKPSKPSTRASRQSGKEETAAGTRWVCFTEVEQNQRV